MQGYGFSVWAVPYNSDIIKAKYSMKHIPHITLKTNMIIPENRFIETSCEIVFKNPVCKFPSMYENDPLTASGFYCDINIPTEHDPHMTLWYNFDGPLRVINIPEPTRGEIFLADTRSMDPSEWRIICS